MELGRAAHPPPRFQAVGRAERKIAARLGPNGVVGTTKHAVWLGQAWAPTVFPAWEHIAALFTLHEVGAVAPKPVARRELNDVKCFPATRTTIVARQRCGFCEGRTRRKCAVDAGARKAIATMHRATPATEIGPGAAATSCAGRRFASARGVPQGVHGRERPNKAPCRA